MDGDTVTVSVRNTGDRDGREVVQLYASRPDSTVERVPRWLIGSAAVDAAPGEVAKALITLGDHNSGTGTAPHTWMIEPGTYQLRAGRSVVDLPLTGEISRG